MINKTLLLSQNDIISMSDDKLDQIISIIEQAFISYKEERILLPEKISQIFDPEIQTRINCMPSTLLNEAVCGVKWVSVFPSNTNLNAVPNVTGTIMLSDITNGTLISVMDGTYITALRTACVGGIAAKHLAKMDSRVICLIGSGVQAKMHFRILKRIVSTIDTCFVASRTIDSEMKCINELSEEFDDVIFKPCNGDYGMASENADIIVTAVSCQRPLLRADSIKKGAFYCHVGGWEDEYEVALKADKIVCDDWASIKHRGSSTIARLNKIGKISDADIYCNLVDIIDNTYRGRESEEEFIYFNSVGLAFVDVAVALFYYKEALNRGLGVFWEN